MTAPWTPLAAAPHAIDCTVRYQGLALGAIDGTNMGLTLYTTIKIEENNSTMATNGSVDTDMGQGLALYTAPSKSSNGSFYDQHHLVFYPSYMWLQLVIYVMSFFLCINL